MPLDPVNLDTVTWTDMASSIRRRIPAASNGAWTLHAPVDPGVTLLELFAYLLEQRSYWMDQVPDGLRSAALALLGEAPRPAQAALTVLQFDPGAGAAVIPAGTRMQLSGQYPPLTFTTADAITALPRYSPGVQVAGIDRSRDLKQGKTVAIFPSDCSSAETIFWFDVTPPLPAAPLALFLQLDTPAAIYPEWSTRAVVDVPPPATVSWLYLSTSGKWNPVPNLDDGTGGFRRSGIVRFPAPQDWARQTAGCPLSARVDPCSFSAPVELVRLAPNAVIAAHRDTVTRNATAGNWMPLPGQTLPTEPSPIEDTVSLQILDAAGNWQPWTAVRDFATHGPADLVFVVDRAASLLRFGDGLTGRIPVPDALNRIQFRLQYETGAGPAGNTGSGLNWQGADDPTLSAVNLVAAEGSAASESLEAAAARAAANLKEQTRAVIAPDYEEIARTTPGIGIARAHAAVGKHPALPCASVPGAVTVYIVPNAPGPAPQPDPGALSAVWQRLDARRVIGMEVFVAGPRYRAVSLTVSLTGTPADPVSLRQAISDRLQTFFDPLQGRDGSGWGFGEALSPSALLREAQAAAGDGVQVTSVSIGLDGAAPSQNCIDVPIGPNDLVTLTGVAIQLTAGPAFTGGLR